MYERIQSKKFEVPGSGGSKKKRNKKSLKKIIKSKLARGRKATKKFICGVFVSCALVAQTVAAALLKLDDCVFTDLVRTAIRYMAEFLILNSFFPYTL